MEDLEVETCEPKGLGVEDKLTLDDLLDLDGVRGSAADCSSGGTVCCCMCILSNFMALCFVVGADPEPSPFLSDDKSVLLSIL